MPAAEWQSLAWLISLNSVTIKSRLSGKVTTVYGKKLRKLVKEALGDHSLTFPRSKVDLL